MGLFILEKLADTVHTGVTATSNNEWWCEGGAEGWGWGGAVRMRCL